MKVTTTYFGKPSIVALRNERVEVKPFQIIVWVSVAADEHSTWDPRMPKFPAILDIGNNHNLAISSDQLARWAGIPPDNLPRLQQMRDRGKKIPLRAANLWLHANGDPYKLEIVEGIAVYEDGGPRLPTLGLRALTNSKLQTFIYGDTKQVLIRTPPKWYWPF